MWDVIVVGARVAGSASAMLLARQGLKVLAVDQATFPSDTLSTHQVQTPGVARLRRWGVLDRLEAAGTPCARNVRFDIGSHVITGSFPVIDDAPGVYSPRRTLLDHVLVDAARAAGAEVREKFQVDGLVHEGGRVCGIRGRGKGSTAVNEERARFVIGADGKHSIVAGAVGARTLRATPSQTFAAYTYWEGVGLHGGELYTRPRVSVGAWPTNGGLTMTFVSWPMDAFGEKRVDIESSLLAALDGAGDLGDRVRAGRRAERIRATTDTPARIMQAHGPGWALIGDAGLVIDPITGQGISHALLQSELLAQALADVLQRGVREDRALERYARERESRIRPMYDFTARLATFVPDPALPILLSAIAGRQSEIDRFLGVGTGSVPIPEYMSLPNMVRLVGLRGLARILGGQARRSATDQAASTSSRTGAGSATTAERAVSRVATTTSASPTVAAASRYPSE